MIRFFRKYYDQDNPEEVKEADVVLALSLFHQATPAEVRRGLIMEMKLSGNFGHRYQTNAACYWTKRSRNARS